MAGKRIKVVHILEGFTGGLSTYVCTVLPAIAQNGFDITLICSLNRAVPDAPERIRKLRQSGIRVHIIPMIRQIRLFDDIHSFVTILRFLQKENVDIVHTHCFKAGVLGRLSAVLAGKNMKVHSPHCFTFLRCGGSFRKWICRKTEKLLGMATDRLLAVSTSEASIAIQANIVRDHKCLIVENGLPNSITYPNGTFLEESSSAIKASFGIDQHMRVVTTACRLVWHKGIFRFLEAAEFSQASDTVFLIAGDGELRHKAEEYIHRNKLNKKVKLLGHVLNMDELYAISNIVVLCSDAEGQPYLLLEAMRARRPIIATSVIGNKDLISHNKTGYLAPPSPNSIAMAIDKLLVDTNKCNKYVQNAYEYFVNHHTLEKQVSALTNIYENCIRNKNK